MDEVINGIRSSAQTRIYTRDTYSLASRTGVGKVFFVDGTDGVDTNSGREPDSPVLTVKQALSLCTADKGDIIQILKNSPSSPHESETWPIAVNKQGVTIRGTLGASGGMLSDSGIGSDEANVATFEIGAAYVTIEDMYIGCAGEGSDTGIITFNGTNNYFGTTIRRCTFETQYIAAYGVYAAHDQPYLLIEDCVFGRHDIAGYTTANIYLGNCTAGMIRRNVFPCVTALGISVGAGCHNLTVLDNRFSLASDTVGMGITAADGSSGCYFDGNRAAFGMDTMAFRPFRDLNNDNSNNWGLNYRLGATITPIGT